MRVLSILLIVLLPAGAKPPLEWKNATIVYVKRQASNASNVVNAPSGIVQAVHEEVDLDAGDVTYTVGDDVVPMQRLQIGDGVTVRFALDGKNVQLKLPDGKTRKMKLIATYPKRSH